MNDNLPGRVLALDIGSVRVGAAVSDPSRTIAQGLGVWQVSGGKSRSRAKTSDPQDKCADENAAVSQERHEVSGWRREFEAAVEKYAPTLVLVGLPRRTTGEVGPEGERILKLVNFMRETYPDLTFETWDERFTTVIAHRSMIEGGVSRKGRRERVDKVAAVLILESWLERAVRPPSVT